MSKPVTRPAVRWAEGAASNLTEFERDRLKRLSPALAAEWCTLRGYAATQEGAPTPVDWSPATAKMTLEPFIRMVEFAEASGCGPITSCADLVRRRTFKAVVRRMRQIWSSPKTALIALGGLRTMLTPLGFSVPDGLKDEIANLKHLPRTNRWDRVPEDLDLVFYKAHKLTSAARLYARVDPLRGALYSRQAALLALAAESGFRRGELAGLRNVNVVLGDDGLYRVYGAASKSKARKPVRAVIRNPYAVECVKYYLEVGRPELARRAEKKANRRVEDALWITKRGREVHVSNITNEIVDTSLPLIGVALTPNLFRRAKTSAARGATAVEAAGNHGPQSTTGRRLYARRAARVLIIENQLRMERLAVEGLKRARERRRTSPRH